VSYLPETCERRAKSRDPGRYDERDGRGPRSRDWFRGGTRDKIGHNEINRQRERAKLALGAAFDLKAFNDTVVGGGNVPLDVLAMNVDEYIGR
jgi:Bacterial protein of unknown function (DUF885)